jgi:hypothetical protein
MIALLTPTAEKVTGKLFEFYAEFLVTATYHRGLVGTASVGYLVSPVPANLLVGLSLEPNDEQVFVDAKDLVSLTQLQPDDYLIDASGGLRRNVLTAHLDVSKTMWTFITRRVFT